MNHKMKKQRKVLKKILRNKSKAREEEKKIAVMIAVMKIQKILNKAKKKNMS